MDPDANLKEQLELANEVLRATDRIGGGFGRGEEARAAVDKAERLAELVLALDEWIKKGGVLPEAWQSIPRETGPVRPEGCTCPPIRTLYEPSCPVHGERRRGLRNEDGEDYILGDAEGPGGRGRR